MQKIDANNIVMSELTLKGFGAPTMKMLQQTIMNVLKTNDKNRKRQQRYRRHKEDPNGNFRTEKCNTKIKRSLDGLNSRMKGTKERVSMN